MTHVKEMDSSFHEGTKQGQTSTDSFCNSPLLRVLLEIKEIITNWSFCTGKACQESYNKRAVIANRWCSSYYTKDLHLQFPDEQFRKLICFTSVSPWKPLRRMAVQGFLLTHLKYVTELHLKGQFIMRMAKALKDSESFSVAVEWEAWLEIITRRPQLVGLFTSDNIMQYQEQKTPIQAMNIALGSVSQIKHNNKNLPC